MVLGQLSPRKIAPPPDNYLLDNFPLDNCPLTIAPMENFPLETYPLIIKFPSKITAPTQPNSAKEYYEWTEENYALSMSTIIYEYFSLGVKSELLQYISYRF